MIGNVGLGQLEAPQVEEPPEIEHHLIVQGAVPDCQRQQLVLLGSDCFANGLPVLGVAFEDFDSHTVCSNLVNVSWLEEPL